MSTIPQTGDPSIDGLLTWVTSGGNLTSPGAIIGLGAIIKLVIIPLLASIAQWFNFPFTGPNRLHGVIGAGWALVGAISVVTRQHMSLGDVMLLGSQAALVAIGIHEGVSTLSDATQAKADQDQVAAALALPDSDDSGD